MVIPLVDAAPHGVNSIPTHWLLFGWRSYNQRPARVTPGPTPRSHRTQGEKAPIFTSENLPYMPYNSEKESVYLLRRYRPAR